MSENSKIEWTHHTFNPWSGCHKVSPACTNCYAANLPPAMRRHAEWGANTPRMPASESYWREPIKWNAKAAKAGERARVFCASVADVFEDRPDLDAWRERLWLLIAATPWLDWLLLTKRPHVMARWAETHPWPANAWAGATVEDQKRADERIPDLLRVPARVRFLSMEPLGGPVDLCETRPDGERYSWLRQTFWREEKARAVSDAPRIHWVIVGGESGLKARPMNPEWARSLRGQCVAAGVAFHFKQWGEWAPLIGRPGDGWYTPDGVCRTRMALVQDGDNPHPPMWRTGKVEAGRILDGRTWTEFPA